MSRRVRLPLTGLEQIVHDGHRSGTTTYALRLPDRLHETEHLMAATGQEDVDNPVPMIRRCQ